VLTCTEFGDFVIHVASSAAAAVSVDDVAVVTPSAPPVPVDLIRLSIFSHRWVLLLLGFLL
jgi:hypothetical protein